MNKDINHLSNTRDFMSHDDAKHLVENAEKWSGAKIRDTTNQEIINLLREQTVIRINNESLVIPIDYDIQFKDGFQPVVAVSFSQFGKKPQTICHFAAQNPVILEGRFNGVMRDIAYLLPLRQLLGTKIRGNVPKSASKSNNELMLKILDGINETASLLRDNSSDIKDVSRDIKDVSLNVKDLLLKAK